MSSRATRLGWFALLAAALLVRAAAVLWLSPIDPQRDGYEHAPIARHLVAGEGFTVRFLGATGPTSQQAPFYPSLLASLYWLFGVDSQAALAALEWLQVMAGAALVVAVVRSVWSLVPQRSVGWAAGWFAALYPPHVYLVTHVQVALWASLAAVWFLAIMAADRSRDNRRSQWRQALAGGVVAGWALLIEPILALVLPVGWCLYTWRACRGRANQRQRSWEMLVQRQGSIEESHEACAALEVDSAKPRTGWASFRVAQQGWADAPLVRPAAVVLAAALTITPWMIRNRLVHGEWVFIKSTFGYAFWQGNNPVSWGTDKVPLATRSVPALRPASWAAQDRLLRDQRLATRYIDDVALTPADYARLATRSEPARSRWLARRSVAWITAHPEEYFLRCARRLKYYLLFDETNPKCAHPLYRASTIFWFVLTMVGALLGLVRRGASPSRPGANETADERSALQGLSPRAAAPGPQLWPLYVLAALLTAFHSLVITSARFRMPLEALTFAWAGLVLGPISERLFAACRRWTVRRAVNETPEGTAVALGGPVHGAHELRGPHRPGILRRRALWETVSRRRDVR